jgi:hypothetical protein
MLGDCDGSTVFVPEMYSAMTWPGAAWIGAGLLYPALMKIGV